MTTQATSEQAQAEVPADTFDWPQFILELTDSAIWPVVVLALLGGVFRKPLAELLRRVTRFGREGIEVALPKQESSPSAPPERPIAQNAQDAHPLVLEEAERLKAELDAVQPSLGIDREVVLLRALAGARIMTHFEWAYGNIFGSQIRCMEFLNTVTSASAQSIRSFYDVAAEKHPDLYSNYTFQQWLSWLVAQTRFIEGAGDAYQISVLGREFLKYLIEKRYPLVKGA